jgi:glutamyl-Q tRNA(Asp) synthetase
MEDLDTPRCVPGMADDILRTLDAFGLHSDEPVIYQSQRTAAYDEALQHLQASGAAYPCCCTRKEIADSALHGIEGFVYPGICREGMAHQRATPAWRVRTDRYPSPVAFDDALQGRICQNLASEIGDFVVKRADGLYAYQLAVVADDAFQRITHIVRGADLLNSTPRQIHLQYLLGLSTPHYMHLPVALNAAGEKLSKQTLALAVDSARPVSALWQALAFLQQQPPQALQDERLDTLWEWAHQNWRTERLVGCRALPSMTEELDHRGHE